MMSFLWLVPYGDNRGGVVERNGSICANNLHKQSPSSTTHVSMSSLMDTRKKVSTFLNLRSVKATNSFVQSL